jgi:predicted nucleic acid-binding protein
MKYLVDSDTCIDYLQGMRYVGPLLRDLSTDATETLAVSLATYGELRAGIAYARDPQRAERDVAAFLRLVAIVPINRAIMRRFGDLKADLGHRGQLIGDFDTLIAATALHHGLTLVTRNRRHFARIPGLLLHQQ